MEEGDSEDLGMFLSPNGEWVRPAADRGKETTFSEIYEQSSASVACWKIAKRWAWVSSSEISVFPLDKRKVRNSTL
jgi:hypothetical protein